MIPASRAARLTRFHALTARLSGRRSPAERLVGSQRLEFFPGAALEPDRIAHEYLSCMCFIDYLHELALVAFHTNAMGEPKIVAAGQLLMERNRNEAEVAVLISDEFQHRGIGTELLRRLVEVGRSEHIARMVGYILSNNSAMLHALQTPRIPSRTRVRRSDGSSTFDREAPGWASSACARC